MAGGGSENGTVGTGPTDTGSGMTTSGCDKHKRAIAEAKAQTQGVRRRGQSSEL